MERYSRIFAFKHSVNSNISTLEVIIVMHLLQSYALQSGQKISRIHLLEKYFPLPVKRYITFQPFSKPAKSFSYWSSVLELIHPILENADIKIIQLGGAGEPNLPGCLNYQGQTNIGQTAFAIKNAMLHLGCDSFQIHLAGHFDVPLVGIYGNANYVDNVKPFFGDPRKQIIIQCDTKGEKPSFAAEENPKSIDRIKPEQIAAAICKLLNLPFDYPYETVFIGANFHNLTMECVPNQICDIANLQSGQLVMRMDYEFNENNLAEQLKRNKCTVVTNKPINMELIRFFKSQIQEVVCIIEKENSPAFPESIRAAGVPFRLGSHLSEDEIRQLKLDYFDLGLITQIGPRVPDELKNLDCFYYRSCKFTLSNQKVYNSKYAFKNGFEAKGLGENWQKFEKNNIYANDFWSEIENFHVLVDANDKKN